MDAQAIILEHLKENDEELNYIAKEIWIIRKWRCRKNLPASC